MAEIAQKVAENVPGRYYVDRTCIDCEACREIAPAHFARHDPARYSFVSRQPENEREDAECRAALAECPVEAIGDDGTV